MHQKRSSGFPRQGQEAKMYKNASERMPKGRPKSPKWSQEAGPESQIGRKRPPRPPKSRNKYKKRLTSKLQSARQKGYDKKLGS